MHWIFCVINVKELDFVLRVPLDCFDNGLGVTALAISNLSLEIKKFYYN